MRPAAFCPGCPHNRSTLLLEGQVAGGGIGCHTMAMRIGDPNRTFSFLTHMGGEGAPPQFRGAAVSPAARVV
jgi:indolepyruvate ferredoxin oxidoreductase